MLGWAYCFVIFVFVRGGPEILFVIAVVRVLCVGHSRMSARSRRACIGLWTGVRLSGEVAVHTVGSRVLRAVPRASVPGHQTETSGNNITVLQDELLLKKSQKCQSRRLKRSGTKRETAGTSLHPCDSFFPCCVECLTVPCGHASDYQIAHSRINLRREKQACVACQVLVLCSVALRLIVESRRFL